MRVALLQLTSSDSPDDNLPVTRAALGEAAADGAAFVLTPEVTNCVSASRTRQREVLRHEVEDPTLAALREDAARLGVWLSIGSLALKTDDAEGRFANRSFLVSPVGEIVARYDKIHMFDVAVSAEETYRESAGYRPGATAVLAETEIGRIGLTICYDLRFPHLYRRLAQAGAEILLVPSAFSPATGPAHWEPLLKARAIETGAFVLAAAQTGTHAAVSGRSRRTHGHSLAVSPWGETIAAAADEPGVIFAEIDVSEVAEARRRIPALEHDRPIAGPG